MCVYALSALLHVKVLFKVCACECVGVMTIERPVHRSD